MTLEAKHYEETRRRLVKDPIVRAMAKEMGPVGRGEGMETVLHDDGTPRFEFMQAANAEYKKRGGTDGGHIGAIAEALLRVREEDDFVGRQ